MLLKATARPTSCWKKPTMRSKECSRRTPPSLPWKTGRVSCASPGKPTRPPPAPKNPLEPARLGHNANPYSKPLPIVLLVSAGIPRSPPTVFQTGPREPSRPSCLHLPLPRHRSAPCGTYGREWAHRSTAVKLAGLGALAHLILLVALGSAERGYQADGDEKRAVFFADHLERRDIFLVAAGAQPPQGIPSLKLRDIRSQVARFQGNLFRRATHAHRQRAMLPAPQRRRIGCEFQLDENHGELWRIAFCARDRELRGPGFELRRRENRQRQGRRSQHQGAVVPNGDVVRIGVPAKSLAENFKAVRQRSHMRSRGDFHRGRRRLRRRENHGRHAPRPTLNRPENDAGIQRRYEKRPARRVRAEMVAVGETDRDSRGEPPIHIKDRQRGAFAGNDAPRQEQDAGRGRSSRRERRLLRDQCGSQTARDPPGNEEEFAAGSHS